MSNYCNPIDRAKNPQLDTICACKDASDVIVKEVAAFQLARQQYDSDYSAFSKSREDWNVKFDTWKRQKIDQEQYLINEKKKLNECLIANNGASEFCSQDHGSGWKFSYWENDNCGLFRRGICQRNTDKINSDLLAWERINPAPIEPVFTKEAPNSVTNTLQCCSQNFSDISTTSGALSFSGIVQNCNQEINTKINNLLATPSPTSVPTSPILVTPKPNEPPSKLSKLISENKTLIILIIVFIIFLFFLLLLI